MNSSIEGKLIEDSSLTSDMPLVVYIMGTGRSGTTALEILLANNDRIAGLGEVTHIFRDGFIDNADCSCGQRASACPLWSRIALRCGWGSDNYDAFARLFHNIAWHSRFPAIAAGMLPVDVKDRYKAANACLFSAAASLTSSSLIVDSSKYAGRALALARLFPDTIKVICLTRSPAGLVSAFNRSDAGEQKPKSLVSVFIYYIYTLACFRLVAWILGPKLLRITYEDIMGHPIETLEKIGHWCGRDLGRAISAIRKDQLLEVGHIVTGNRLRKQGKIKFRPSAKIDERTGLTNLIVVWLMNAYRVILGF